MTDALVFVVCVAGTVTVVGIAAWLREVCPWRS